MKYWLYVENDVWGNQKEGFEVNDSVLTSVCLELDENFNDKDLFKKLKKSGIIGKGKHFKNLEIDGDDRLLCLSFKDYPFGALYQVEEGQMITFTNMHREFNKNNFNVY
jgi:hypothetical protein